MKLLYVILFQLLLFSSFLMKVGITAHWYFNNAEFTQLNCENKNVKGSTCKGKCHLKKQLTILSDNEQKSEKESQTQFPTVWQEENVYILNEFGLSTCICNNLPNQFNSIYQDFQSKAKLIALIQPPDYQLV